ncbi:MAG: hypothetical protein M3162_03380 [Thermoproteota archaeon]|nr:hypothetical protein [Thermoproteota archaeon]
MSVNTNKTKIGVATTYLRPSIGLGLVGIVPLDWLNKKVEFNFEGKSYQTNVIYRARKSIIQLKNVQHSNGGSVTVRLID